MCGIAGYTKLDHPIESGRIRSVIETIRHRGPDQQGVHETGLVSLGAARLAILDLDHGDQPMFAADSDLVIAFNGEIYNHGELRRELESLGHSFSSHGDTEVVLKGFLEWDAGVFERLRGMFAVALWRESERRLVLARDRMGIKPLYVFFRGRDLYFGSELKCLFAHPEVPRRLDRNGLSYYLSLNWVPYPYTLAEGIEKVAPGEWIEWRNGFLSRSRYWSLRFQPSPSVTEPQACAELDSLLRTAVCEHLISDVPLGVWASGGLDSSTVLHYAAQAVPNLKTFSVSFRGHGHDESAYFNEVARVYGTDHHVFDLNPEEDLEGAIRQMVHYSDEPSADAGALPVWFLSRMTRGQVTVALSGEGADELFGGYLTYQADAFALRARRIPAWLRRAGLGLLSLWPVSDEKISLEFKAKRFLEGSLLDGPAAHLYWNGTLDEQTKRSLYAASHYPTPGELMNTLPTEAFTAGPVNRYLWLDQRYYLPDDILVKCDRMSMAHSLEVRPPFLDHRIVEFAARLPEDLKIRGGVLKYLLRRLMQDKLPRVVLERKKEGFDIPAHRWFRGPLRPLMEETLSRQAVIQTGLFSADAVEKLKAAHLQRRANLGYPLWGLLILFLWMREWKIDCNTA